MPDDTSVILFGTNARPSSATVSRFEHFSQTIQQAYKTNNDSHSPIELIFARSADEIFHQLESNRERLIGFHFEGRSEHYDLLLALSARHRIDNLPRYLGEIKSLKLVFLSGCARGTYIDELLSAGVPAVVTSSKKLDNAEIEQFAESVHKKLAEGLSLEDAFTYARQSLGVVSGQKQRIYVNLRDQPPGRKWRLPPRIFGPPDPKIFGGTGESGKINISDNVNAPSGSSSAAAGFGGASSSPSVPNGGSGEPPRGSAAAAPPPPPLPSTASVAGDKQSKRKPVPQTNFTRKTPFVGNRPYTKDDADIFFGRDTAIESLLAWVADSSIPFMLLSGAVGGGKTSLLQAGLIPQLELIEPKPRVYALSAATDHDMLGKLQELLRRDSGKSTLLEAWKQIECFQKRRIVLIVDDIGSPRINPVPSQTGALPRLLKGLSPVFADTTFTAKATALFSVRTHKIAEVEQECQNSGFAFSRFPLPNLDDQNLRDAIRKSFASYSIENVGIADGVSDEIVKLIQSDPASPGLTYMQMMILRLWNCARDAKPDPPVITVESYQKLYENAMLLDYFLEGQLQSIRKKLGNRYSLAQLLHFLRFHFDAHSKPLSRSSRERCMAFPKIPAADIQQLQTEMVENRLLIQSDQETCGKLQIAHAVLAPHVINRLLNENQPDMKPPRTWHVLVNGNTEDDCLDQPSPNCVAASKPDQCPSPQPEPVPACDRPSPPITTPPCEPPPLNKPCPHPPNPHGDKHCKKQGNTQSSKTQLNILLLETALLISVVMAVVLFGVLLLGLAFGTDPFFSPLQINVISH